MNMTASIFMYQGEVTRWTCN